MSLTRYSELALLTTVLALVLTASVAGAVTVSDATVPDEGEVGEEVTLEAELTDLYSEDAEWQFAATTELESAEWTAELYRDGEQVDTDSDSGSELSPIELDESASDAPDTVEVTVTGEVPAVESFSYEDGQEFQALELLGHTGSMFEIESYSVDQYTADSSEARAAIEDARSAIDDASDDGADVSDAESHYDDAVAAYDDGDFDAAVSSANDAVDSLPADDATSDDASSDDGDATDSESEESTEDPDDAESETTDEDDAAADDSNDGSGLLTLLLYGLGFVALVAVVGGVFYVRQQQQSPNRDPLGK